MTPDHTPSSPTVGAGPVRVQLSRAKGWRKPDNTVVVARPTKYGNPHDWRDWLENADRSALPMSAERERWAKERATQAFEEDLRDGTIVLDLTPLRGKNLACWCKGPRWSCHADVLLALSNGEHSRGGEADD